ncbi:MAG TPA: ornithine cyclodeaminase family protein, partial [Pseudonocardiaceae bacterium]|nr:ornithine cyclodeaminase family protein [Pseudonocardiaceae bacterium]
PRIQGKYLLLDGPTLTPVALVDAMALTALRTAAVSAVAVDALAKPLASSLVVFGTGPQARAHVAAIRAVRTIKQVIVVGRDRGKADAFAAEIGGARVGWSEDVAQADVVACCTTARTPLFDGRLLRPAATVVAVGSHEPDAAEVDATAFGTVVVEARRTALREAGDIVLAKLRPESLVELGTLVRDGVALSGPRLFKSVGMAWEDLVVAATIHQQSQ